MRGEPALAQPQSSAAKPESMDSKDWMTPPDAARVPALAEGTSEDEGDDVDCKASWVRSASTTGRSSKSKSDGSGGSKAARSKLPRPDAPSPECPRCHAEGGNTKFCYYNNYNINQPRYYCKACQRHWTAGGVLRKVETGAGKRNSRRHKPATVTPHGSLSAAAAEMPPAADTDTATLGAERTVAAPTAAQVGAETSKADSGPTFVPSVPDTMPAGFDADAAATADAPQRPDSALLDISVGTATMSSSRAAGGQTLAADGQMTFDDPDSLCMVPWSASQAQQTQAIADLDALFTDDALDNIFGTSAGTSLDMPASLLGGASQPQMTSWGGKRDGPSAELPLSTDRCQDSADDSTGLSASPHKCHRTAAMSLGANSGAALASGTHAVTSAVRPASWTPAPQMLTGSVPVDSFNNAPPSASAGGLTTTDFTMAHDSDAAGMHTASVSPRGVRGPFMVSQQALCSTGPCGADAGAAHASEMDAVHAAHAVAYTTLQDMHGGFSFGGGEAASAPAHVMISSDAAAEHRSPSPSWLGLSVHGSAAPRGPDGSGGYGLPGGAMPQYLASGPSPSSVPTFWPSPAMDGEVPGFMASRLGSAPAFVGVLGPYGYSGFMDGQS